MREPISAMGSSSPIPCRMSPIPFWSSNFVTPATACVSDDYYPICVDQVVSTFSVRVYNVAMTLANFAIGDYLKGDRTCILIQLSLRLDLGIDAERNTATSRGQCRRISAVPLVGIF